MKRTPFLLCLLLLTASCGPAGDGAPDAKGASGAKAPAAAAPAGRRLGVSFQTMNNPFFVDLNEGLKSVVEAHGDKLVTLDAQFNSLKQLRDISDLVLEGVSVIFVNPVNWEGIRGSLLAAKEKGIPVIVVDAPVRDRELTLSTVVSNNVEAGRLAARALAGAVKTGEVGVLGYSVNKACIDRVAGFREEIAKHPGLEIADVTELKSGTRESGRPLMQDMIGRRPGLAAVFAINDPSALGAISALESAGKLESVKVVSVDGAPEAIQAIAQGKLLASSAQFPREIGRIAAGVAYDHLEGRPVEKDIEVKVELITKENAASHGKRN